MARQFILILLSILTVSSVSSLHSVMGDFSASSVVRSDIRDYKGYDYGSVVSESRVSPNGGSAAFQSGTTVYGANDPNFYTGLSGSLNGSSRITVLALNNFKISVSIKDSSGVSVSPSRITLSALDSPHDSCGSPCDYSGILVDLYNYLASYEGLPSQPSLANGQAATITSSDSNSVWAQWRVSVPSGWDKGLNFRYQPDFPSPGVYTVAVSVHAELWEWISLDTIIDYANVDSAYSFQYVYENDANSGNDAGSTFSTALGISLGTYNGLLYGADTVDMYKFDGFAGQNYYFSLVPPQSANFGISIYDPNWNFVTGSNRGTGQSNYGSFIASSTGSYFANVSRNGGSGVYTLTISNSPIPLDFSISVSPSSLSICQGQHGYPFANLRSLNGFSGSVSISGTGLPNSLGTWATGPTTLVPGGTASTQLVVDSGSAPGGTYTIIVTGTSGSLTHTVPVSVYVGVPPWDPVCGSPGGGSVMAGTMITMADGSTVPVQSLKVGMEVLSYDMTTQQFVHTKITRFVTVTVHNEMVIRTVDGRSLTTDQNPAQKLYVMFPNGTWTLLPVTELNVGYRLFDPTGQTWIPITHIHYKNHGTYVMYDIYPTAPGNYIANGYLDPYKT